MGLQSHFAINKINSYVGMQKLTLTSHELDHRSVHGSFCWNGKIKTI